MPYEVALAMTFSDFARRSSFVSPPLATQLGALALLDYSPKEVFIRGYRHLAEQADRAPGS